MIEHVLAEFSGAELGDKRRNKRLLEIVAQLHNSPSQTFPQIFTSDHEIEAFYRFIENPYFDGNDILAPHIAASLDRASNVEQLVILHDTSKFSFPGQYEGFWGHVSLAVDLKSKRPIGVLRAYSWERQLTRKAAKKLGLPREQIEQIPSEYQRWSDGIQDCAALSAKTAGAIHVCDSEADCYDLLNSLVKNNQRFVIRAANNRPIKGGKRLKDELALSPVIAERTVQISSRRKAINATTKRNQVRKERVARLMISRETVEIVRPRSASAESKSMSVNVVYVQEVDVPEDCNAVNWTLVTTEKISSERDVLEIIDIYRMRWLIEEYFKALKTGCSYESRQLEGYENLSKCFALFAPLAWLMLHMRTVSHEEGEISSEAVLPPLYLEVLTLHKGAEIKTGQEALLSVARLGGHLKRNGPPGWQTIWRGLLELNMLVRGYKLAQELFVKKKM